MSQRLLVLLTMVAALSGDASRMVSRQAPAAAGVANTACPFSGQSVLIIGGTSGIGKSAAEEFIRYGAARVHIIGRSTSKGAAAKEELLRNIAKLASEPASCVRKGDVNDIVWSHSLDIGSFGDSTSAMQDFLSDKDSMFQKDMCKYPLKYAVNSAAITGPVGATYDMTPGFMKDTVRGNAFRSNTEGTLWSVAAEWAYFREMAKKCGEAGDVVDVSIVAISSLDGIRACPGCAVYSMTKYSINGLVNSVALEARQDRNRIIDLGSGKNLTLNLRVNSVLPALVSTPFTWNQGRMLKFQSGSQCCNGKLRDATVEECAEAVMKGKAHLVDSELLCPDPEECQCDNVAESDPIWKKAISPEYLASMLTPRDIAGTIVSVSNPFLSSAVTGGNIAADFGAHNM